MTHAHASSLADHFKACPCPAVTDPFKDATGKIDWAKFIAFVMQFLTIILPLLTPVVPTPPTPSPAPKL